MKMVAVAILVIAPKIREDVQSVVRLKGDSTVESRFKKDFWSDQNLFF